MRRLYVAEPVAAYRTRPPIVVDASVLAASILGEPTRAEAELLMRGRRLTAPTLIDYELTHVAVRKLRAHALSERQFTAAMENFAALDLVRHAVDPLPMSALARRYEMSAYDAAYLWLAGLLDAPLVTFDRQLARAALDHLNRPKDNRA